VASGAKAGTYNLVTTSDTLPELCLGGCVYTKESDPVPGTNYCFRAGQGEVSCSGGGCEGGGGGDVEGWIEKYFEKKCSTQFNSVLNVGLSKGWQGQQCGPNENNPISNITLKVFDNADCEGKPLQEKLAQGYQSNNILIRIEDTNSWSVQATSEKFETVCQDIGNMIPFTSNYRSIRLIEKEEKVEMIRTASLDFSYNTTKNLVPAVFVLSTPYSCTNSSSGKFRSSSKDKNSKPGKKNKGQKKKNKNSKRKPKKKRPKKKSTSDYDFFERNPANKRRKRQYGGSGCGGSGWGSGGSGSGWGPGGCNWKCQPTCQYTARSTEPSMFPCHCQGLVGAGLNNSYPSGKTGRFDWYDNPAIPPYYYPTKYFLVFAEFNRRENSDLPVCDSKLSLTYNSPNKTQQITKDAPCFTKPEPPPTIMPTFPRQQGEGSGNTATPVTGDIPEPVPGSGLLTTSSSLVDSGSSFSVTSDPSGLGSGTTLPWPTSYPQYLTTINYQDMFTETEGVLIWGGSDRFWIVGCMEDSSKDKLITFDVEFFTSKEPYATPEFCGCVLSTVQGEETMAPKDLVKDCYVKAIKGGPAPRTGRTVKKRTRKDKQRRKSVRKNQRRTRKQPRKMRFGQRRKSLRAMIKSMKEKDKHFNGRSKRDIPDENFDNELFTEEDYLEEEDFLEEEDLSNDQDYEESSFHKMRNDEDDYDDYDYDYDYNMSSDWI